MIKRSSQGPHQYGRKVCIFCGNTPTTGEHVWPKWARDLFPSSSHYAHWAMTGRWSSPIVSRDKNLLRQGSVKGLKVHRLCATCNGAWRGRAESDLKPLLTRLFNGDPIVLTETLQNVLTEYLTAKVLTLDWVDGTPVTDLEISHAFYAERRPPPGFKLYIFNCLEGNWRAQYRGFGCILHHSESESDEAANTPNTKSFAIGFGNLFVFAIISLEVDIDPNFGPDNNVRLWPNLRRTAVWPPRFPIDSKMAEGIAVTLDRAFNFPATGV